MPDSALDSIFKAYDVRGIYPDELDESIARRIGNAFVAFTGSARVLVGRDARPSSAPLVAAFTEGAVVAGADVAGQCLGRGLVDEILVYVLPVLLGEVAGEEPADYRCQRGIVGDIGR